MYSRYYAQAYALLTAKSSSFSVISSATQTILNVLKEINTRTTLCTTFGVSEETPLTQTPESPATAAYGAYLIDVGRGTAGNIVVLLSCLLGYGEVGLWLMSNVWPTIHSQLSEATIAEGNQMKDYPRGRYLNVKMSLETIGACAAVDPPLKHRLRSGVTACCSGSVVRLV
ncbi:hypothetical protein BDP27DRAFT_1366824 [Rhodocollybia butyracea]|uniref:Thiaminase-2/PQQC domain-containing protein n=1 Tax=Rhodocollybia butyracea TaxID=206335 RepID=A0A9P5PGI4_9AGAR|nr:hypothetical protein BDP27DRAFT_1366824 [Rhodocollybia butyracea]